MVEKVLQIVTFGGAWPEAATATAQTPTPMPILEGTLPVPTLRYAVDGRESVRIQKPDAATVWRKPLFAPALGDACRCQAELPICRMGLQCLIGRSLPLPSLLTHITQTM